MSARIPKELLWAVIAVVALVAGLLAFLSSPAQSQTGVPITVSFQGYSPGSNGIWIASFCMSNHSRVIVDYVGDGPTAPFYALYGPGPTNNGTATGTNYHAKPTAAFSFLQLPPGRSVTFAVPMPGGTNSMSMNVQYLAREDASFMDLSRWMMGAKRKRVFQQLTLETPF